MQRPSDTLLALDQGTTSTRAIAYDESLRTLHVARRELPQSFPRPGWVEHDPERIREDAIATLREAMGAVEHRAGPVAAIGITNQRETVVVWERATGRPIHPAIVWQDRRTADICRALREAGQEDLVRRRTGLVLDPYFSATKLAWILDSVDGARRAATRGELAFGTIDTWLLWCLTGGAVHATDVSNASRTALFDIDRLRWDPELLDLFGVPEAVLPEVRDSAGDFGRTTPDLLGAAILIRAVAGDQQAALFGQAAFAPGAVKCTFGTGAFALLNTGAERLHSQNRLLTTIAWRIHSTTTYALEGSIFTAGATIQWLRDGLGIIDEASETEPLAASVDDTGGVYLVPAFVGLGAPHWDAGARGAIVGLTRDTGRGSIARASLESVAYQTRELLEAMRADGAQPPPALRVDGGFARNDWAMQFLADLVDVPVERPADVETTALGAASLAGLGGGVFGSLEEIASAWQADRAWQPSMDESRRSALYEGWKRAVQRVLSPEEVGRRGRQGTIEVRKIEPSDIDRVLEIWRAATVVAHPFQGPDEVDRDEALIRNEYMHRVESWVAVDSRTGPVGFVSLAGRRIVALFVDPSRHRNGVGSRLIAHVNALHGPLSVEVFAENVVAVTFYEKHGFRRDRVEGNPLYPDHEQWILSQVGAEG